MNEYLNVFYSSFLFKGIEKDKINALLSVCNPQLVEYQPKQIVFSPSDSKKAIGFILSGKVVVTTKFPNSNVILKHLSTNDCFGVAGLFGDVDNYVSSITSVTKTSIVYLSQHDVRELIHHNSMCTENYIVFLSEKIRFLNDKIACITSGSATNVVAKYLLNISEGEDSVFTLNTPLATLAQILDIGRASLYRALDSLQEFGAIKKDGKNISIIDKQKLLMF